MPAGRMHSARPFRFWRQPHIPAMREPDARQSTLFTVMSVEDRVPRQHPLRQVRAAAAAAISELRHRLDAAYARSPKSTTAPEEVLRLLLLWGLYGIPSERRLLEEVDYNLLFRWFVGYQLDDTILSRDAFRDHRDRLVETGILGEFVRATLGRLPTRVLINPHFTPNRPLLESWAGQLRWDEAAPRPGRKARA
jgi:transposase